LQRELQHTYFCEHTMHVLSELKARPKRAMQAPNPIKESKEDLHDDRSNKGGETNGLLSLNLPNDMERMGTPEDSQRGSKPQMTEKSKKQKPDREDFKKTSGVDCTTIYNPNGKAE